MITTHDTKTWIERFHSEMGAPDPRGSFQRDRDRVLYSASFRRLAETTQVVSGQERYVFHNRLTHSLEVAQLSRRLAERLIDSLGADASSVLIDADVAETAALIHDTGHPPFGHLGEETLDEASLQYSPDGYEGNAQSFRIVTHLSTHNPSFGGLNLTRRTLLASLKYPWVRKKEGIRWKKFGVYQADREVFEWLISPYDGPPESKCCEAAIMDWSDDVAYSTHDLFDFTVAGMIPLHLLASSWDIYSQFADPILREKGLSQEAKRTVFELLTLYPNRLPFRPVRQDYASLKFFINMLIKMFLNQCVDVGLRENGAKIEVASGADEVVEIFKQMTVRYVIENPALKSVQIGQRRVVKELFEILHHDASHNGDLYGDDAKNMLLEGEDPVRLSLDYISGLTEAQATKLYNRLTGADTGSLFEGNYFPLR